MLSYKPKHITAVEGVNQQMIDETLAKFDKWDSTVASMDEENPSDEYFDLLEDPTIYAYAFFKDGKGKPFKMYPYQDAIINDPSRRIIFSAANQIGKSITLCLKALTFALHNPGKTVLMISKTLPQAKDLLRQIKEFLNSSSLEYRYDIGDTETKTEIYFRHYEEIERYDEKLDKTFIEKRELRQSRIICVPATEGALGYPVDLELIDELAFYEDGEYFYTQIGQPRTYTTKGQIIVFSNPNGQQGVFWRLWKNDKFSKYRFTFTDCPTNTEEEFNILSSDLTQQQIDSTLMAVFTSPIGGFISLNERKSMQEDRAPMVPNNPPQPLFIFFDFAKTVDRTVRSIGYPQGDGKPWVYVADMLEYPNGTSYSLIIDELVELINNIGFERIAMVGWDNTGVGRGIEDFIRRIEDMGILCTPVEFSLENKSAVYTGFKLLIERNLRQNDIGLKIPFMPECDSQLSKLRFKRSAKGYLQVHHEKESDRDDFPDSLAGLCSLIIQPESPPVTCEMIVAGKGANVQTDFDRCECGNIWDPEDEFCTNCRKERMEEI